jgi:hypothetical protein
MTVVALAAAAVLLVLIVLGVVFVRAIGVWIRQLWPH